MIRKEKFCPGEYYHIYSRTILNVPEFKDYKNAQKLCRAFLLANSTSSGEAFDYLRTNRNSSLEKALEIVKQGDKLVDVVCYSIMPDHYHLLLKELKDNGIIDFIRKCNTSIAKYINIKNERSGVLFESRFKSKHVSSNDYLLHLSLYIHLNPLDFLDGKDWRFNKLKDWHSKKNKLLNYQWSSLKSFLDDNSEDKIISGTEIVLDQFKNKKEYELFLREWSEESFSRINDLILE